MKSTSDAFWLGAILLGMGIAAVVGILVVRGLFIRMRQSEDSPPFTLQDLREMRDNGEISASEYQSMRQAMIGSVDRPTPGKQPPSKPDTLEDNPDLWPDDPNRWLDDDNSRSSGR